MYLWAQLVYLIAIIISNVKFTTSLSSVKRSVETYYDELEIHSGSVPDPVDEFYEEQEVLLFRLALSEMRGSNSFNGKMHPFIELSYANGSSNNFIYFARTKSLSDTREPHWDEVIKFEKYRRGGRQTILFEIRDHDSPDWDHRVSWAYMSVDDCVLESRPKPVKLTKSKTKPWSLLPSHCSAQISDDSGNIILVLL